MSFGSLDVWQVIDEYVERYKVGRASFEEKDDGMKFYEMGQNDFYENFALFLAQVSR